MSRINQPFPWFSSSPPPQTPPMPHSRLFSAAPPSSARTVDTYRTAPLFFDDEPSQCVRQRVHSSSIPNEEGVRIFASPGTNVSYQEESRLLSEHRGGGTGEVEGHLSSMSTPSLQPLHPQEDKASLRRLSYNGAGRDILAKQKGQFEELKEWCKELIRESWLICHLRSAVDPRYCVGKIGDYGDCLRAALELSSNQRLNRTALIGGVIAITLVAGVSQILGASFIASGVAVLGTALLVKLIRDYIFLRLERQTPFFLYDAPEDPDEIEHQQEALRRARNYTAVNQFG